MRVWRVREATRRDAMGWGAREGRGDARTRRGRREGWMVGAADSIRGETDEACVRACVRRAA